MKTTQISRVRKHAFHFKLDDGQVITARANVVEAKKSVTLVLTKEHIEQSIAMKGQGNTQKCAMAVCSREHGKLFPHAVLFVDWLYNRAYVVTKTKNGLPSECVVYDHGDNVAPLFDTAKGMEKLLRCVRRNGFKRITLHPPKVRDRQPRKIPSKVTGERTRTISAKGAKLRFANARLGGAAA